MFERCLYFNTNALVRRINKRWEAAYEKTGLSPSHAYLLRLVLEKKELSQKQITEELQLEKSTVTRFVDVLTEKGLLKRTKRGREQMISVTEKGKKLKTQLNRIGDKLYTDLQSEFGSSELKGLVDSLQRTSAKL